MSSGISKAKMEEDGKECERWYWRYVDRSHCSFFCHSDLSGPMLCICLVERRKGRSVVDEHVLV